ncbi:MAG: sialate O-acetylesterase [Spirochaetia bacterium]|nr:sialate O-acetylesterase [Spirochaetia bacterium]
MKRVLLIICAASAIFVLGILTATFLRPQRQIVDLPPGKLPALAVPAQFHGRLSLFVLAGQSNMSGRGASITLPHTDRIFLFANDYHWKQAREPLDDPEGQIDEVSLDKNAGSGPGLAFASKLAAVYPGKVIGLIPCARGATTMFEWERRLGDDSLYGSCLKRIGAARALGKVEGVLFFQGEWDAIDDSRADAPLAQNWSWPSKLPGSRITYTQQTLKGPFSFNRASHKQWAEMFSDYVDSMRHDLESPGLPVVFAQIGHHEDSSRYAYWKEVQESQKSVSMPRVKMIETSDLDLQDNVHLSTQSYLTAGARMADGFIEITDPARSAPKPVDPKPAEQKK